MTNPRRPPTAHGRDAGLSALPSAADGSGAGLSFLPPVTNASDAALSVSSWEELLDAMEEGLASYPPVVVDALPDEPGPIPPVLVARAVDTLRRMAEAEATLDAHRADIARELIGLSAARTAAAGMTPPSVPRFLDTKA